MHEYSLVGSLMQTVEAQVKAHGAASVARLVVHIGDQAGVERDLFVTAFETFKPGTVCAGAALEIVAVPARWGCRRCDVTLEPGQPLRCPRCGDPARLVQGDELILARMELEVPDV